MLKLEELKTGISLIGIEPTLVATIIAVVPIAEGAIQVIYEAPDRMIKDHLLGHAEEESISLAMVERPWALEGVLYAVVHPRTH